VRVSRVRRVGGQGPGQRAGDQLGCAPVAEQFQAGSRRPAEANETKDSPTGSWSVTVKGPRGVGGPRFVTESA